MKVQIIFSKLKEELTNKAGKEKVLSRKGKVPSPRKIAFENNIVSKKTWEGAQSRFNKNISDIITINFEELINLFAIDFKGNLNEWILSASTSNIMDPKINACAYAPSFLKALKEEKGYDGTISKIELKNICDLANVDMFFLISIARNITQSPSDVKARLKNKIIFERTRKPLDRKFLDEHLDDLRTLIHHIARKSRTNYLSVVDAEQELFIILVNYGGKILEMNLPYEDTLNCLGGYLRACITTIRAKYQLKESYIEREVNGEDLGDHNTLLISNKNTELEAIENLMTNEERLEELAKKFGMTLEEVKITIDNYMKG